MKPAAFDYVKPSSVDEALSLLGEHPDAVVLAGGQSLLPMLNMRLVAPSHVVDIAAIPDLKTISLQDGTLRIGALACHSDLASSPQILEAVPLLSEAVLHIGHPAIRNRGTIGGSLSLADPAAELPACLLALDGSVEIVGPDGSRVVPASNFFTGTFETALKPGELLSAVEIPVPADGYRSGFSELARRHGDYALAGLAAFGRVDGGSVHDLRLAFFAVGDRPMLATATAQKLEGQKLTPETIASAIGNLGKDIQVIGQPGCGVQTKLQHCGVLTRRVLARLVA